MTWDEVWSRRLTRHRLASPAPRGELVATVRAVCGVHAQLATSAEVAIGLRVAGCTRADVRAELWEHRRLVKIHRRRGTLHLVPAAELAMWVAAFADRAEADAERSREQMEVERARFDEMVAATGEALRGRTLDRDELGAEVARLVGPWAAAERFPAFGQMWPRWRAAIQHATALGIACHGPNRGNRSTYVRAADWIGPQRLVDHGTALREVARRFLAGYGPASADNLAQWLAISPAAARRVLEPMAGELVEVDVEGWRAWLPAADADPVEPVRGSVRLLPLFDDYVIGCHPRDRLVPARWADRVLSGGAAGPVAVLLVDGRIAGRWHRRSAGRRIAMRVEPFRKLTAAQRAEVRVEADRVAGILQGRAEVTFGPIEVGPHL